MPGLQLALQVGQRRAGRNDVQVLEAGLVHIADRVLLREAVAKGVVEEVGNRRTDVLGVVAQQIAAGIALRVQVNQQGLPALVRGNGGQVHGDGRFADPALLVKNTALHGFLLLWPTR